MTAAYRLGLLHGVGAALAFVGLLLALGVLELEETP